MSVVWHDRALDLLAGIYVGAAPHEREGLVAHVERINARLAADPWAVGESRGPYRRAWFHWPLVVVYDLPPGGGVVVGHVARLRGRRDDGDEPPG